MVKIRQEFADFGEIKEFFDLVAKRGMVFITYVSHELLKSLRCLRWTSLI